jgi:hypothetical protein
VHAGEENVHKRITSREHTLASRILNTRNPGRHVKMLIAMTDITAKWHHSRALKASNMAFLFETQITEFSETDVNLYYKIALMQFFCALISKEALRRSPSVLSLTSCRINREGLNIRRIFIGHLKITN